MWQASESEVNSWLFDSLLRSTKKLKNGWNKKTRKAKEGGQILSRNCSTNTLRKKAFRSRKTRRTQMLKLFAVILFTCKTMIIKQLLNSVFAISGIIKVEVLKTVISRSRFNIGRARSARTIWNYEHDYPWIVRHKVQLPINRICNKMPD